MESRRCTRRRVPWRAARAPKAFLANAGCGAHWNALAAADFFSEAFVRQVVRQLTAPGEGVLDGDRILICDRDRKWSLAVRELLETGARDQRPFRAPNCNAHAERLFGPSKRNAWMG